MDGPLAHYFNKYGQIDGTHYLAKVTPEQVIAGQLATEVGSEEFYERLLNVDLSRAPDLPEPKLPDNTSYRDSKERVGERMIFLRGWGVQIPVEWLPEGDDIVPKEPAKLTSASILLYHLLVHVKFIQDVRVNPTEEKIDAFPQMVEKLKAVIEGRIDYINRLGILTVESVYGMHGAKGNTSRKLLPSETREVLSLVLNGLENRVPPAATPAE